MRMKTWLVTGFLCAAVVSVRAQSQLPNLTNAAPAARFTIAPRVWSTNSGAASICLWEDDKLAALSLTVDDNSASNIDWWLTQADAYGFKMTWNVITGIVGDGNALHGTWSQYSNVLARGHDVQSHSVTHDNGDAEYRDSQIAVEANLPGHKCEFIAYPGGSAHPSDPVTAANYYGSGRGTTGQINQANKITYMNVYAMSSYNVTNMAAPYSCLNSLLITNDMRYYRGWAVQIHHWVTNYTQQVQPELDFYDAHRTDIWMGRYGDVAKYGQERDTAKLTTNENSSTRIALGLTDQMLDSRFNYPLTLKVRLPATWTGVQATQNGQPITSSVVAYNGGNYALVKAVPDQGEIALTPPVDGNGNGIPDSWESQYYGTNSVNPSALAANGLNTIREMYIAGLNPTDGQAVFAISNGASASAMRWDAVSGRVYNIYWTTNLLTGFQPLATNIAWPQNSWTDLVHGAQNDGFYQIKVQLGQ